jgi:polar amino acid transport system substrate-binding protein
MRQLLACTIFLCSVFFTFQSVMASQPLMVTGNPEAPPIVWEKQDKLIGVGPEIATRVLNKLQIPFTIKPTGSWAQVQENAKNGAIDLVVSAYDNAERRQYMDYSIPYLQSPVVIVVKRGKSFPFKAWKDLIGKKGVANTGESFGEEFDTFIKEKLDVTYTPYERAFKMMELDSADYLIVDLYPAIIYSKMLNVEDRVEFLDAPATTQFFHMTISKKSPYVKLMPKINAVMKEMKKNGEFNKLVKEQYNKWNKTFKERQRFFGRSGAQAQQAQSNWDAGSRDRGLDNMSRFIERDMPYMDGSNFMN